MFIALNIFALERSIKSFDTFYNDVSMKSNDSKNICFNDRWAITKYLFFVLIVLKENIWIKGKRTRFRLSGNVASWFSVFAGLMYLKDMPRGALHTFLVPSCIEPVCIRLDVFC